MVDIALPKHTYNRLKKILKTAHPISEYPKGEGEVSTISSQLALTQMDGNILLIITEKGEKIATSPRSL